MFAWCWKAFRYILSQCLQSPDNESINAKWLLSIFENEHVGGAVTGVALNDRDCNLPAVHVVSPANLPPPATAVAP